MNQENLGAASTSEASLSELDHIYYAITIKPVKKDRVYWATDFTPIIENRLRRFKRLKQVWELDANTTLHTHMLTSGPKDIKYKLIHLYGWHIYIEPLKTEESKKRWEGYLDKYRDTDVLLRQASMHYDLFEYNCIPGSSL